MIYITAQTAVQKISGNYSCTALSQQYTHERGTKSSGYSEHTSYN